MILDTNVVSELMRTAPHASVQSWVDSLPASELHLTAITAAELSYGVARLPKGRRRFQLAEAIRTLLDAEFAGRVLAFDVVAAGHYGDIAARRTAAGRPTSAADAQIAAICRSYDAGLATRNTSGFTGTGIDLIDPWTESNAH